MEIPKAAQNESLQLETLADPPRCEIRADAVTGIDETENFNTDGRLATRIITFRGDGRRWHRLWVCDQCLSDGSFKREIPDVSGQEVQVFVFDRTISQTKVLPTL